MAVADVMELYLTALAEHDLEQLDRVTAADLHFVTPFGTLRKADFLATMHGIFTGFPDWVVDHGRLRVGWDHATVELRMEGTHTGTLVLPILGVPAVAPTGRVVVLPAQDEQHSISQGRITRIEPDLAPGSGIPGMLEQLGATRG